MTAPATLAEAQAQCRGLGVDLRKAPLGSVHMSECMDLIAPFCVGGRNGILADIENELPVCVSEAIDPAKAAAELKEAEAKQLALATANPGPWFWLALTGGVAGLVAFSYYASR